MEMNRHSLELYTSIHEYEKVIECLMLVGRKSDAEALIRSKLEAEPDNPSLWCRLGTVTKDLTFYEKAWEVSGERHGEAQRLLGKEKRLRKLWSEAVVHYRLALAVN